MPSILLGYSCVIRNLFDKVHSLYILTKDDKVFFKPRAMERLTVLHLSYLYRYYDTKVSVIFYLKMSFCINLLKGN